MDRSKLPYRKNCEGYFLYKDEFVLARDTRLGYIEFPGGGVDNDAIEKAMVRETLEETGATIKDLSQIGIVYFDWDTEWAKTDKQKERYQKFRGEEMHLFVGVVESFQEPEGDPETGEVGWEGERFIEVNQLIKFIESLKPYRPAMNDYHEKQLEILKSFISV